MNDNYDDLYNGVYFKINLETLTPIHKFNNGRGATLCNSCRIIISEGMTEDVLCPKCIEEFKQKDGYERK